jgi:hypothetical protein
VAPGSNYAIAMPGGVDVADPGGFLRAPGNCFGQSELNVGQLLRGVLPCAFRHIWTKTGLDTST